MITPMDELYARIRNDALIQARTGYPSAIPHSTVPTISGGIPVAPAIEIQSMRQQQIQDEIKIKQLTNDLRNAQATNQKMMAISYTSEFMCGTPMPITGPDLDKVSPAMMIEDKGPVMNSGTGWVGSTAEPASSSMNMSMPMAPNMNPNPGSVTQMGQIQIAPFTGFTNQSENPTQHEPKIMAPPVPAVRPASMSMNTDTIIVQRGGSSKGAMPMEIPLTQLNTTWTPNGSVLWAHGVCAFMEMLLDRIELVHGCQTGIWSDSTIFSMIKGMIPSLFTSLGYVKPLAKSELLSVSLMQMLALSAKAMNVPLIITHNVSHLKLLMSVVTSMIKNDNAARAIQLIESLIKALTLYEWMLPRPFDWLVCGLNDRMLEPLNTPDGEIVSVSLRRDVQMPVTMSIPDLDIAKMIISELTNPALELMMQMIRSNGTNLEVGITAALNNSLIWIRANIGRQIMFSDDSKRKINRALQSHPRFAFMRMYLI